MTRPEPERTPPQVGRAEERVADDGSHVSALTLDRRRALHQAPMSVYQRIADDIAAQIESGELAPGATMPSESEMIETYGVSRVTIRNAIRVLRDRGFLDVRRGQATTVRASLANDSVAHFAFDPTILRESGPQGISFTTWEASDWLDVIEPRLFRSDAVMFGHLLHLGDAEPILIRERQLAHTNGIEITYRVYLPFATFTRIPDLVSDPFRSPGELYGALTSAGRVLHWEDNTRTTMPSRREAVDLGLPDGVPLLVLLRLTLDKDDHPLMLEEIRLPGHLTSIVTRLPGMTPADDVPEGSPARR